MTQCSNSMTVMTVKACFVNFQSCEVCMCVFEMVFQVSRVILLLYGESLSPDYSRHPSKLLLRLFWGVHFISFSRIMFRWCCLETTLVFAITWCPPQWMHLWTHRPVLIGVPLHVFSSLTWYTSQSLEYIKCTPQQIRWCAAQFNAMHWYTSAIAFNCLRGRHLKSLIPNINHLVYPSITWCTLVSSSAN